MNPWSRERPYTSPSDEASARTAAVSGSGRAQMGDELHAPAGAKVEVSVHVAGVPGGRIAIAGDAVGLVRPGELNLTSDDQTLAFDLIADGRPRWLRVDVRDGAGKLVLIGNPIYLRP